MPADARAKLDAVGDALDSSAARTRQLRGVQRVAASAASSAFVASAGYAIAVALLGGLFTRWMASEMWIRGGFVPVYAGVLTFLVTVPTLVRTARAGRRVRVSCAASPPLRPGDPAACRVCGAPIAGAEGIVRCAYCASDNVLDARVLSRASQRQDEEIADEEALLQDRTTALGEVRVSGLAFATAFALVAAPFFATTSGPGLNRYVESKLWHADSLIRDIDADVRLPLVETELEERVPWKAPRPNVFQFDANPPSDSTYGYLVTREHPSWLIGKEDARGSGRIVAVRRHVVYGDLAIVERDGVRTPKSFFDLAVYGEPTAAFTERKKARWSR